MKKKKKINHVELMDKMLRPTMVKKLGEVKTNYNIISNENT